MIYHCLYIQTLYAFVSLISMLSRTQLDYTHKKREVINYHASLRDSSHPERLIDTGAKVFLNFCFHKMFSKPVFD